jgi:hypothetical protein
MTIREAINTADSGITNGIEFQNKLRWLSDLDGKVFSMMRRYVDSPSVAFHGYDEETNTDTQMLIEAPYDDIYVIYLQMKIFLCLAEYARYNNAALLYNEAWQRYANHYNRNHMHKETKIRYF